MQVRDEERQHDQFSQADDVVQSEHASPSKTRFTNQGEIPPVEKGVGAHGPSASDRAFGSLTVTARGLNVRSGPSTNDRVLGMLHRGDVVQEVGRSGGWVQISYRSTRAYVHSAYVTSSDQAAKEPGHAPGAEDHDMFPEVKAGPAGEQAATQATGPAQGHAPSKEDQAEVMQMFREVNGEQGRGAPPSKEDQAEVMQMFREVNGGPAGEKAAAGSAQPAAAQGHAPSKEHLAELVAELE